MNPRYQRGGDLYAALAERYGVNAADRLADLDSAGDSRGFQQLLSDLRNGTVARTWGSESVLENFYDQITTDPLAAPLDSLDNQLGKAVWNVVKNPFVLALVAGLVFWQLGGFGWLKKRLA